MELRGYHRLNASALIAGCVIFVGFSYWHYGFKAQAQLQLIHMLPLLFAGLTLGRAGVWLTMGALLCALMLGVVGDAVGDNGIPLSVGLMNLNQPVLASLLIAATLDRLVSKSLRSDQHCRQLALVCDELEGAIRAKEQKQAQLVHSQKMDALGQLAGGIAHDFNNLLGVILGYATDPMNVVNPQQALDSLDGIEKAARRGGKVLRRLLSLSRAPGMAATFDAAAALDEVAPLVRSLFSRKVDVLLRPSPGSYPVRLDRQEFELAILNIARNARDAMPDGGKFELAIDQDEAQVTLTLSDTGHGMPPEVAARIFEPFYTTKPEGLGTGIGLAVVYQSITEAGGSIDVASSQGGGTTVRIALPRAL